MYPSCMMAVSLLKLKDPTQNISLFTFSPRYPLSIHLPKSAIFALNSSICSVSDLGCFPCPCVGILSPIFTNLQLFSWRYDCLYRSKCPSQCSFIYVVTKGDAHAYSDFLPDPVLHSLYPFERLSSLSFTTKSISLCAQRWVAHREKNTYTQELSHGLNLMVSKGYNICVHFWGMLGLPPVLCKLYKL